MKKEQFIEELKNRLKGLPKADLEDRISFYEEAINDRIADGKTEEEAVRDIGTVDEAINEIAKDTPLVKLVKEKVTPKRSLTALEVVLLILGFPLWFPLVLTAFILCLVGYLLIWVFVFVSYVTETALAVSSIGALIAMFASIGSGAFNLAALGASIMCAGGAILWVFVCIAVTKLTIELSKSIIGGIKKSIMKKGNN